MNIAMFLKQAPVQPILLNIVTIVVVIPLLRAPNLISHLEHRYPYRQDCRDEQVLHLLIAQVCYDWVVGWPLDAAIPTPIVVTAIAVFLKVGFIVFVVVRNEVVQGEPIVRSDEIDAGIWLFAHMLVQVGTAC